MKTLKTHGTAAIGAICLFGLCGVRGVAPNLAAQSGGESNKGWALVDCDKEESGALQRAIDRATSGQTIQVRGTCHENVSVLPGKDLITLDGGGVANNHDRYANPNVLGLRAGAPLIVPDVGAYSERVRGQQWCWVYGKPSEHTFCTSGAAGST
jgi:hypothetical protein